MLGGKGIKAAKLRPFSVEDPDGSGRLAKNAAERRLEKIHEGLSRRRQGLSKRVEPPRRSSSLEKDPSQQRRARRDSSDLRQVVLGKLTERLESKRQRSDSSTKAQPPETRSSTPQRTRPTRKAPQKKGCLGCLGCFPLLLIFIFVFTAVPQLTTFIEAQIAQQELRSSGTVADAQVVEIERTLFGTEQQALYEVQLLVHLPGTEPYPVSLQQIFSTENAQYLTVGSWVQVRYDPADPDSAVIVTVASSAPSKTYRPTQRL